MIDKQKQPKCNSCALEDVKYLSLCVLANYDKPYPKCYMNKYNVYASANIINYELIHSQR